MRAAVYIACINIILLLNGCAWNTVINTSVDPKHFNVQLPFQNDNKGILISTYWGQDQKEYKLYLDNHSPTWANDNVLLGNASVYKSKNFLYRTSTADGKIIAGDVYIGSRISIAGIDFKNIAIYNISSKTNQGSTDGAIGQDIMAEGIWKIDFKEQLITLASAIDSIEGLEEAEILPAVFTEKAIEIEATFHNNHKEKIELDLGYNGHIILPSAAFASITAGNQRTFTEPRRFSTPAGHSDVENTMISDSIRAGGQSFRSFISTNKLVKEKLLGLGFLKQFEFIVIDYLNKTVYLSKKRLH